MTQPIFQRGKLVANLKVSKAEEQIAKMNYQQTILEAGKEVSDALFLYDTADKKLTEHQAQVSEMQKAVEMNKDLFQAGKATYLEIITAQQSLLSAQLNEVSDTFQNDTNMISPLAYVDPSAKIGKNVTIHPFVYIDKNVEIGDNNVIMPNASLMSGARIGNGNTIYNGAVIAAAPQDFNYKGDETIARIGDNNTIRENAVIIRATFGGDETVVGNNNFIMQGARISHDVIIGNGCIIGNGSQVSGCCVIEDYAILTSNVLMQGHTRLGTYAAVQGGCRFTKDIPPYCVAAHEPTSFYSINTMVLQHEGFSETVLKHIAHAFRILYKANTSVEDALRRIEEQVPSSPEIVHLVEFVRNSKLGIIK